MNSSEKLFSIVVPVYFNEENLPETIPNLLALQQLLPGYGLELVFIDDGSGDNSLKILLDFQKQYPDIIQIVKLTRNFGAETATQVGLLYAKGNCVGIIAADLQDPPELFLDMIKHWEKGSRVVFGVRQDREDGFFPKMFSNIYYYLVRKFAIANYPKGGIGISLIDRQVVNEVNKIMEKNSSIHPLICWLGYKPAFISYIRRSRKKGKSRWTLQKKIKLFVDTFVSFSYLPLRLFSVIGLLLALGAFIYACYVIYGWLRFGIIVQGWFSIILILTITSGVQMTMLGILGEYLWRTLEETRKRPHFVVDSIFPNTSFENQDSENNQTEISNCR